VRRCGNNTFDVMVYEQCRSLTEIGIPERRIVLKRLASPVTFPLGIKPLQLPDELRGGAGVILYSGNWGVAHDEATFIEGYSKYVSQSKRPFRFWLNATGAKADRVEAELRLRGVPVYRSTLVPLADLPRLLLSADVHLITLRDTFVGYVLPSKIHACIESGKRVLFVGSEDSDVHLLAREGVPSGRYERVNVGDVNMCANILHTWEKDIQRENVARFGDLYSIPGKRVAF